MPLAPGSRLGPYQVESTIGAGGMGEVYRARDTRLGRDVAVKVLPPAFAADPDRLRRFEQEARAASQLNHPNIVAVFDVGSDSGVSYLVEELLDGETLRARLESSPLPARKAIDTAAHVADAIAAAHEKGIVHRDLKPDNIFLTRDGRVKVLDFGLAKLREGQANALAGVDVPTIAATKTGEGIVLGTVGYMSPEQVRARPADGRSDIFTLGTILYEMVTGRRPFQRDSAAETMTAIVRDEPPPLEQSGVAAPPALARVIDHCLEKNPDQRFQSARDLGFALRALSDASGSRVSEAGAAVSGSTGPRLRASNRLVPAIAVVLLAGVAAGAYIVGRRSATVAPPLFEKITFRQGAINGARFGPDGKSVIYSAEIAHPDQVFLAQPGNPESRPMDLPSARMLSVSKSGELLVMLNPQPQGGFIFAGTLARVPASGGAPRELLEGVEDADWSPDGESIAVVRTVAGRGRLEFPIGTVLFDTAGWISSVRVGPRGDTVGFLNHPFRGNDAGEVAVVDRNKRVTTLSRGWFTEQGLAWAGDRILFTAAVTGATRRLYDVSPGGGAARLVAAGTGSLFVYDAAPSGEVLLARVSDRIGLVVRTPTDKAEREMSWLDWSLIRDMSDDGKVITFDETGEGGGPSGSVYLRRTDGSPAVRLGDGGWPMLSPDGRWVSSVRDDPPRIMILPTGAGESRVLATPRVTPLSASWFPDGRRLLVAGNETGHSLRNWVVPFEGGDPRPVTPEGSNAFVRAISPDGRYVLTIGPDGKYALFPVDGGPAVPVAGIGPTELAARMPTPDTAYVFDRLIRPVPLTLANLKTGARKLITTIGAGVPGETARPIAMRVSADGRTYAYSYFQSTSELFLMKKAPGP